MSDIGQDVVPSILYVYYLLHFFFKINSVFNSWLYKDGVSLLSTSWDNCWNKNLLRYWLIILKMLIIWLVFSFSYTSYFFLVVCSYPFINCVSDSVRKLQLLLLLLLLLWFSFLDGRIVLELVVFLVVCPMFSIWFDITVCPFINFVMTTVESKEWNYFQMST